MSLSIPSLFARCISDASKAFGAPTVENSTQDLVRSSLKDLNTITARITDLSLFSPNETLEDISTKNLIYLLVPYVTAEVRGRVRTTREERVDVLRHTQKDLQIFLSYLENYEIVPREERILRERKTFTIADAAKRRDMKIKQYQKEKDLRARIEASRKHRGQLLPSYGAPSELDFIASLLPEESNRNTGDEELDSETDDPLRETTILLLRLCYAQAHSQLESMIQELELLANAPPPRDALEKNEDRRRLGRESDSNMWKLDELGSDGKGPLLDPFGKPLRPFTILPSGAADRARFQAQVFGPGHRLPTMSIEEYLQIERARGNILTGGGPASEAAPTTSEQLALEAEMDGTRAGEEKAEVKRLKDEDWARFTDVNPKGAGNTLNRG